MSVQDDVRENELIALFGLNRPEKASRSGTDAELCIDGRVISFEIKSTTDKGESVTTVRDFGPDHIRKWKGKHWVIGIYSAADVPVLSYCRYGSPADMKPWIDDRESYVSLDFMLADEIPGLLDEPLARKILGDKEIFLVEDAMRIQKNQLKKAEYHRRKDLENGFSFARMVEFLKERVDYLIKRGATLNNPHIPGKIVKIFQKIDTDHAAQLQRFVLSYLESTRDTDSAT